MPEVRRPRPTVSIVIPAYNEEETIEASVRAAPSQTLPAHEVIVVDNRSRDCTAEIVRGLQEEFPDGRIRLISQDAEQGLVPTRNVGLTPRRGRSAGSTPTRSSSRTGWRTSRASSRT